MTNQTIPPCPACGVVPIKHAKNDRILLCGCFEEYGAMMADVVSLQKYQLMCVDMLGRACREFGIETVEQLKARLATGPRVAVLEAEIDRLVEVNRRLVNERTVLLDVKTTDGLTASEWVMRTAIAESKLKLIAAQRGAGDGE